LIGDLRLSVDRAGDDDVAAGEACIEFGEREDRMVPSLALATT